MNELEKLTKALPEYMSSNFLNVIINSKLNLEISNVPNLKNRVITKKIDSCGAIYLLYEVEEKIKKNPEGYIVTELLPFYDMINKEWFMIKNQRQEDEYYA